MPDAIVADALSHRHASARGPIEVLGGLDLRVPVGEHLTIVGRSGSGKSTLLALLGGLEPPQQGRLEVLGCTLAELSSDELAHFRSTDVGFVFQHFGLVETLSAVENVELAATFAGSRRSERHRRAEMLLDLIGLSERRDHKPAALSGGERQRVAIARALMNAPRLLLADEPTGNLDDESAAIVADLLESLPSSTGATVVVVTHDHAWVQRSDRSLRLDAGRLTTTVQAARSARP